MALVYLYRYNELKMVKSILLIVLILVQQQLMAQSSGIDASKLTVAERYQLMKAKSQTYGEYKAIKESDLDGTWKVMKDSLQANRVLLSQLNQHINALQARVDSIQLAIQQTEASVQDIKFDSTHINVLGINFNKLFFLSLMGAILAVLIIGVFALIGRMKLIQLTLKAKSELAETTLREFDEYRKKAMEKQSKLARELQTELNRPGR
jgi:hypothetical protein